MNSMCKNCSHLDRSCPGSESDVWDGCILKNRTEEEAADYIDKMTEAYKEAVKHGKKRTAES